MGEARRTSPPKIPYPLSGRDVQWTKEVSTDRSKMGLSLTSGGISKVVNLHSEITRLSNTSDRL